ncbi:hypothetical protein GCM10010341_60240 [Streptomyces noursei]|nr:hypothetical protein GCM10010341_60240 [Streptomyces noursei]
MPAGDRGVQGGEPAASACPVGQPHRCQQLWVRRVGQQFGGRLPARVDGGDAQVEEGGAAAEVEGAARRARAPKAADRCRTPDAAVSPPTTHLGELTLVVHGP